MPTLALILSKRQKLVITFFLIHKKCYDQTTKYTYLNSKSLTFIIKKSFLSGKEYFNSSIPKFEILFNVKTFTKIPFLFQFLQI